MRYKTFQEGGIKEQPLIFVMKGRQLKLVSNNRVSAA
jgi:hypothetical protein